MAGPKAPLVFLLVAFFYAKLINGLPVDVDDYYTTDEQLNNYEEQTIAGTNVEANVSEGGIDISSIDHEQESEDSESYISQGSQSVVKGGGMNFGGNNYNTQGAMNFGGNNYQGGNIVSNGDFTMGGNNYNGGGISMQTGSSLSLSSYGDTVHLTNNDIDETVSGMSSTSSSMFDKRVFIGAFNSKGMSVWSDKSNEIVLIKDNKDCQQMTYKNHVRVSSEELSTSECAKVLDKVKLMEKDVENLNREMAQMTQDIQQSVQESLADTFNNYNYNSDISFGNNWPFGPNNNPFAPNNGNSGKNGKPGRKSRRSSRRRVPYQPDVVNNYYN